jgi:hypothetical protein
MNGGSSLLGPEIVVGTGVAARPTLVDESGNVLLGVVNGVPDDSIVGFSKACLLQRTDSVALYINKGDETSATWSSITIP